MALQKLKDDTIRHILELIDKREYTQQELAERYHVSQGTISRYNRVKRLQFKVEDNAKLIAMLNMELFSLKQKFKVDTKGDFITPESFLNVELKVKFDGGRYAKLKALFTNSHYDALRFHDRHPEFTMYRLLTDPKYKDDKTLKNIPRYLRSSKGKYEYGYIFTMDNIGTFSAKDQKEIMTFEFK